jgi:hypothetical protein
MSNKRSWAEVTFSINGEKHKGRIVEEEDIKFPEEQTEEGMESIETISEAPRGNNRRGRGERR